MQSLNNIFGPNNDIEIQKAKKKFSTMTTKNLHGHLKRGNYLAWNITGDKLASGSMDDSVRVWGSIERKSAYSQNDSLHLKGHMGSINQVAWDPTNAESLASTSDDKTIRLWDSRTGQCTSNLETKTESTNLVWSPDGNTIVISSKAYMGGQVDALLLLDVRNAAKLKKVIKFHYSVNHMAWHKDSANHIYLATGKGDIEIFNWPEFKAVKLIDAHTSPAFCVEFSPNGNYFAVGSADTLVSLWDKKDHVCLRTFGNLTAAVKSISFSHDNQYIAIGGSEDNFIDISHLESGENIHTIQNGSPINCVSWHPKKHLLAYAGKEKDKHDRDTGCIKVFGFH
jgi:THO complex subunit 3